ncbi:YHS domain-containing (seleno)protein [uncultured Devosia sp.]|uniref:YHS domain-containing (seleno)protein n=1 Tax=uncultured Devosia sp. TaxID=211434 RepID=UPI0035CA1444
MLAFVLPLLGVAAPAWGQSIISEIVTDPLTGIALGGMDPVSYFTEDAPLLGRGDLEYVWKGVPWHFANPANRDVFERSPAIYAPQFGGHGAMSAARGFVSDADPMIYTVFKQRLYLFYSAGSREAFLLAPDAAASKGAANWPDLAKTLSSR